MFKVCFWFSWMHGMYVYMDGVNSNLSLEVAMKLVTNSFSNIDKSIELHVGNTIIQLIFLVPVPAVAYNIGYSC